MNEQWIAERMRGIEVSGIRKVFDLAANLKDPVNLSIGQPHFPVPDSIKAAAKKAIDDDKNGYTVTQGIAPLRERLLADLKTKYPGQDRSVIVTSGTSGGLALALLCTINPGDEVIFFDPYFVMYPHFLTLAGGKAVVIDTYPDFQINLDRLNAAITPKTKAIVVNSPGNPTGVVASRDTLREVARIAKEKNILLISDEIYHAFAYDAPFASPAEFSEDCLVIDGMGKTYGITGWRLGFAHGPKRLIEEMTKLQQFTYVCAPSVVQYAGMAMLDYDVSGIVADYKQKRDRLAVGLKGLYDFNLPGGAFYLFAKAPWGTGTEFVTEAIKNNLLIIPGGTFSKRDTHFRISYAASDTMIDRGLEILRMLAKRPG
jgi:aspartate/methionine/tyrosine aminotransferase